MADTETKPPPMTRRQRVIFGVAAVVYLGLMLVCLFVVAGRWDWVAAWILFGLWMLLGTTSRVIVKRRNPGLLAWRQRIGDNTKPWDRRWLAVLRLLMLATMAVAALDAVRLGWSSMPAWLWAVGLSLMLLGYAVTTWAMSTNPHFEGTVRIQHDRGHRVIEAGPYGLVRHPGYVGMSLIMLAMPLLLLSWWAFVPTLVSVAWMMLRTVLEDRTLRQELAGYDEYATRTRHRLLPGVW